MMSKEIEEDDEDEDEYDYGGITPWIRKYLPP
jgi:hypothetical protein